MLLKFLTYLCLNSSLLIIIIIIIIDINREIQELEQGKTYMYLGIEESEGIQHQQMKERLKQEYSRRLRMILKSELKARNKITAIGTLAVPVLRYSFGIINRRDSVEIQFWYN